MGSARVHRDEILNSVRTPLGTCRYSRLDSVEVPRTAQHQPSGCPQLSPSPTWHLHGLGRQCTLTTEDIRMVCHQWQPSPNLDTLREHSVCWEHCVSRNCSVQSEEKALLRATRLARSNQRVCSGCVRTRCALPVVMGVHRRSGCPQNSYA